MSEPQRSYYAIIPANVRYDESLTPNAKLLYGEITALCNERGYCWAGNSYFANLYGVSNKSVSSWINQLVDRGYLTSEMNYKEGSKEVLSRYLRIAAPIEEKVNAYGKKVHDPMEENFHTYGRKVHDPMEEKVKDNNTINNTYNNTTNIYSSAKAEPSVPYKEIIEHLNLATNSNYRHTTKSTQNLIKARFNEGFTLDDFKEAIDAKANEWLNDQKMAKYLRPQTLFGTKFESYLNQSTMQPKQLGHTADAPTESSQVKYDDDELEYANALIEQGTKQFKSLNAEEQKQLNAWRQRNAIPLLEMG